MLKGNTGGLLAAACAAAVLSLQPVLSHAKIVCWKDKSGKVIGCGDTVPPEYQESATKELDKRGITRKTTESASEVARQRAQAEEAAKHKADADRRAAEQKRQDSALLATYASEQEIDGKRDRDLQALDLQLSQLQGSLKNAADRYKDAKSRLDAAGKSSKGGASDTLKDEVARAGDTTRKLEQSIASKEQEKSDIRARYAEYRKRYAELRSGAPK